MSVVGASNGLEVGGSRSHGGGVVISRLGLSGKPVNKVGSPGEGREVRELPRLGGR